MTVPTIREELSAFLAEALRAAQAAGEVASFPAATFEVERRGDEMGDYSSAEAMRLARLASAAPREIADAIVAHVPASASVKHVEVAGPGFINIWLDDAWVLRQIETIIAAMTGSADTGATVVRVNPEDRENYRGLLEKTILQDGVKILLADKECGITYHRRLANDERAIEKAKGYLPEKQFINITPEVCENCLECTRATGCPGLTLEQTPYGQKVQIDKTWCVNDGACTRSLVAPDPAEPQVKACPSFGEVRITREQAPPAAIDRLNFSQLPEPNATRVNGLWHGYLAGVGGMGIGIATATAGIIVGAVSQTGVGLVLADVVEVLSMGNLMLILMLTAVLSLILGMGLPTTANYIVVSALLAPVIVTLGEQNGLLVPLIAVHLFVFYFGIMADVTPPVGLASFAAAAVSGGDPLRTGFQAFYYSLRTAALPFLFIFNTDLLLIDVSFLQGIVVFVVATIAMLIFAAATQGFMLTRNRWYESILLLLVAFTLFRPGFWMDMIHDPYRSIPASQFVQALGEMDDDSTLRVQVAGQDAYGDPLTTYMTLPVPEGKTGEERLENFGLELLVKDGDLVVDMVAFGSQAEKLGFDFDQKIIEVMAPVDRWAKEWMWIPALAVFALIVLMQRRRRDGSAKPASA